MPMHETHKTAENRRTEAPAVQRIVAEQQTTPGRMAPGPSTGDTPGSQVF